MSEHIVGQDTGEPLEPKGRQFKKGGQWYHIAADNGRYVAKLFEKDFVAAADGKWFDAWHLFATGPNGSVVYLPAMVGTCEPNFINGSRCTIITPLHPKQAEAMEQVCQKIFSPIEIAHGSMLKPDGAMPSKGGHLRKL